MLHEMKGPSESFSRRGQCTSGSNRGRSYGILLNTMCTHHPIDEERDAYLFVCFDTFAHDELFECNNNQWIDGWM